MAEPIGDEYTALPHCHADPVHDDEFARKGYVDSMVATGGGGVVDELEELIARILPVGRQEFSPFRADSLPFGWYAMNGQAFLDTSPQGVALLGLPQSYRDDWGIVDSGGMVNVPNYFQNGKGLFVRAVDGTNRAVGSIEHDAGRQILRNGGQGTIGGAYALNGYPTADGAFSLQGQTRVNVQQATSQTTWLGGGGIAANIAADGILDNIADEYRPINIGMTPTIYLGV